MAKPKRKKKVLIEETSPAQHTQVGANISKFNLFTTQDQLIASGSVGLVRKDVHGRKKKQDLGKMTNGMGRTMGSGQAGEHKRQTVCLQNSLCTGCNTETWNGNSEIKRLAQK